MLIKSDRYGRYESNGKYGAVIFLFDSGEIELRVNPTQRIYDHISGSRGFILYYLCSGVCDLFLPRLHFYSF